MSAALDDLKALEAGMRQIEAAMALATERLAQHRQAFADIVALADRPNCLADALDEIRKIAMQFAPPPEQHAEAATT